jgi:hypothetical protein
LRFSREKFRDLTGVFVIEILTIAVLIASLEDSFGCDLHELVKSSLIKIGELL